MTKNSSRGLITTKYRANPLGRDLNEKYHVLVYHVRFNLIQALSRHNTLGLYALVHRIKCWDVFH